MKFRHAVEKTVLPQSRDHKDVGLADPPLQSLEIAHGKAVDTGIERREPLVQLIGNVGEANRKFVVRGKHGPAPSVAKPLLISSPAACRILLTRRRVSPHYPHRYGHFHAFAEQREDPALRGAPVAVPALPRAAWPLPPVMKRANLACGAWVVGLTVSNSMPRPLRTPTKSARPRWDAVHKN